MIVFDMAGTTVNEDNVVYKTVHRCIQEAGFDVSLETVLETAAGKEKKQAIADVLERICGAPQPEKAEAIFAHFVPELKRSYENLDVKSYKGTEELFATLRSRNIFVALNTGYSARVAAQLLEKLHWSPGLQYDVLVTADDVEHGRPWPDMIELAMQRMGLQNPAEVMKIGDSAIDIEEGKAARCGLTAGVTTGAQTRAQLATAKPDFIFDELRELLDILPD